MIKEIMQVKENLLVGDQRVLEQQNKQAEQTKELRRQIRGLEQQIRGLEQKICESLGEPEDKFEDNDLSVWNLGNIGKILDLIEKHLYEKSLYVKGNENLFSRFLQVKKMIPLKYKEEGKMSTVLYGNLYQIFSFLKEKDIRKCIRQIDDQIIFAMPVISNKEVSIIWDESFSDIDKGDDSCWRWLVSDNHEGHIFINNATDYLKQIEVSFHVETLNQNAQVLITNANGSTLLDEQKDFHDELILQPGSNEIVIKYIGDLVKSSNESEARKLQLLVGNFKVVERKAKEMVVYEGEENYKQQYPISIASYIVGDENIRELLHKNGFFEIKTYICSTDDCKLYRKTRA